MTLRLKLSLSFLLVFFLLYGCKSNLPTEFNEAAKNETFLNQHGDSITLNEILSAQKGKKIVMNVWASWCRDCIKGIPDTKQLQSDYPDVQFVFFSLDRSLKAWESAVLNYQLKGEHYYINSGWDGEFSKFLELDWIPRYLVLEENSKILIYKSIRAKDIQLKKILQ